MLAAERRSAILRALNAGGAVRVADLAAELDGVGDDGPPRPRQPSMRRTCCARCTAAR